MTAQRFKQCLYVLAVFSSSLRSVFLPIGFTMFGLLQASLYSFYLPSHLKERYSLPKSLGKGSRIKVAYPDWVNKSIPEPVTLVKEIITSRLLSMLRSRGGLSSYSNQWG